jgi:hypothetical protein
VAGLGDTGFPALLARDTEVATAKAEALAASQPLDSDLTAIAALTTTTYGRAFLALLDAAAGRSALGLGTAATTAATSYDPAGSAAAAQNASQPLDSDLTALAALATTAFGRSLLTQVDAAAARTALALGTAATATTGTLAGEVPVLGVGGRLVIARVASGVADGTKFVRDDGVLATPAGGGGGGALVRIGQVVLSAAAASIDFTAIPGTYENLRIELIVRSTNASNFTPLRLRFNGDTTTNYDSQNIQANGAAIAPTQEIGQTSGRVANSMAAASLAAGTFGTVGMDVPGYARTVARKIARSAYGADALVDTSTVHWRSTTAITSVTLFPTAGSFEIGSSATLYGVT